VCTCLKLDDCDDIFHRRYSLIVQTNNVLCDFVSSAVRYKLLKSYCSSIYGCELWCLDDSKINEFYTTWRRGLRNIWNLPYRAHCVLHALSNDIPVFDEICKRSLWFINTCLSHSNDLLLGMGLCVLQVFRFFGRNFKICSDRYQFKISDALSGDVNFDNVIKQYCLDQADEHCDRVSQFLKELIDTRDFYFRDATCLLSRIKICDIIKFLATE